MHGTLDLLEREDELSALDAALARARARQGQVVAVEGPDERDGDTLDFSHPIVLSAIYNDLPAAGHTNREIAQALFVTEKTVETHLGRAFMKLGGRSRKQLAQVLDRETAEVV